MEGPLRPCASCSSEPGKKRCAICKSVHYCSRECQRNHWKAHKKTCSKKVSVRSQSGSSSPPSTSSTPLPVPIKPHQRRPLKQSAMPSDLRYKYVKSADEVESNLIIFLHGAGDSYDPYLTFFRSMNLPQTSALGLTAPFALPLDMGRCWYPFIDMRDGSVLKPTKMTGGVHPGSRVLGLRKVRAMLTSMLTHLTDPVRGCNWPSERIFWFGFSMGAHVAVDIALHYMPPSLPSSSSPSSASPASASASQSSSDGDTDAKMKDLADRVKHDMKLQQEEKKHHDDTTASAHMNNDHTPQMGENTNINHLAGDSGEDSSTAGMLGQHARVFGGVIAVSSSVMEEYVLNNSEATTRGGSHTRNSNFSNAAGIIGHVSGSSVLERGNLRGTPLLITHGRKDRTMNLQSAMQNIEYLRSLHNNDIGGNSGKTGDSDGSGINNNGESHNNKKKTNARTKTKTKKNRRTNQKNQIKRNGRPSSTPSPPSSPFPSSSPSASSASPSSASSQIYELIDVKVYDKGHSMVSSKEEARDIHIFLSKHMALRSLAMENDPDIIQVV